MVPQIATASLSGLNSTIKFIEFAYKVQGVPEEVKQSLELINRVEGDINEARRLLREKHDILDEGLRQRVIRAIDDAEKSRISIGRTVESCRVDMDRKKDSVAMRHRITWVLRDRDAFQTKERNLDYAHKALLHCISEINLLSGISRLQLQPQPQPPPAYRCDPDDEDLEEFLSPRARRARSLLEMKDSPDYKFEDFSPNVEPFHQPWVENLKQTTADTRGDDDIDDKEIEALLRRAASRRYVS